MEEKRTRTILPNLLTDLVENKDRNVLQTFIGILEENNLACVSSKSSVEKLIGHINLCLGESKSRLNGLVLLETLIEQCGREIFHQYSTVWMNLLLNILKNHNASAVMQVTCKIIEHILMYSTQFPDLTRETSSSQISSLIQLLIDPKPEWCKSAIQCLSACLKYYNGVAVIYIEKIEKFLLSHIDTKDETLIHEMSICYALLVQTGGSGSNGSRHTELWSQQLKKFIVTLHDILAQLYENDVFELNSSYEGVKGLSLGDVALKSPERTVILYKRYKILMIFLQQMFSALSGVQIKIPIEDMLSIICAIAGKSPDQLVDKDTPEALWLLALTPSLQMQAIKLLNVMILSLKSLLIPYGKTINDILVQALSWTDEAKERNLNSHDHNPFYTKTSLFSELQSEVFICTTNWIEIVGISSGFDVCLDVVVSFLIKDWSIQSSMMNNHVNGLDNHQKDKSDSIRSLENIPANPKYIENLRVEGNKVFALKVIRSILLKMGALMSAKVFKKIQDFAVSNLIKWQQETNTQFSLWKDVKCRKLLYKILCMCILVQHHQVPSAKQSAIALFKKGKQDSYIQISNYCTEALLICTNIIHPQGPSLIPVRQHVEAEKNLQPSNFSDMLNICDNIDSNKNSSHLKDKNYIPLHMINPHNRKRRKPNMYEPNISLAAFTKYMANIKSKSPHKSKKNSQIGKNVIEIDNECIELDSSEEDDDEPISTIPITDKRFVEKLVSEVQRKQLLKNKKHNKNNDSVIELVDLDESMPSSPKNGSVISLDELENSSNEEDGSDVEKSKKDKENDIDSAMDIDEVIDDIDENTDSLEKNKTMSDKKNSKNDLDANHKDSSDEDNNSCTDIKSRKSNKNDSKSKSKKDQNDSSGDEIASKKTKKDYVECSEDDSGSKKSSKYKSNAKDSTVAAKSNDDKSDRNKSKNYKSDSSDNETKSKSSKSKKKKSDSSDDDKIGNKKLGSKSKIDKVKSKDSKKSTSDSSDGESSVKVKSKKPTKEDSESSDEEKSDTNLPSKKSSRVTNSKSNSRQTNKDKLSEGSDNEILSKKHSKSTTKKSSKSEENDDINEMLSSFVDAAPDSD